jgi:hypothetical protein
MRIASPVLAAARSIRARLLARKNVERGLAGQCALASMLLAEALGDADTFRMGFFMQHCTFLGKRGRYPHSHAWCQIGDAIIDVTATQFGRYPAIYVTAAKESTRYIECANGADAIAHVMTEWGCNKVAEYRNLRRRLRALDGAIA